MGLFRNKPKSKPLDEIAVEIVPTNEKDKQEFEQAADDARIVSEKFNSQLLANGFTIKIFVAAGGKRKEDK